MISSQPVPYGAAVDIMERRAAAIAEARAREAVWLLEHPPLYTAGTSAKPVDLLQPGRFEVHATGRGGQYTYHGPGQRVVYVMLRLDRTARDVRRFVCELERWLIDALAEFNVAGFIRDGRVGVWVSRPERGAGCEDKIAALGIRVRRAVSLHGMSLNVDPDLSDFDGIVPCGIDAADGRLGVTSLLDLGRIVSMPEVDMVLRRTFEGRFSATVDAPDPLAVARG